MPITNDNLFVPGGLSPSWKFPIGIPQGGMIVQCPVGGPVADPCSGGGGGGGKRKLIL